jgi:hypothetical protein
MTNDLEADERRSAVSLREFFDRILIEMDKRYEDRFVAQKEAIRVALEAQERAYKHTVWLIGAILAALQLGLHFLR